VSRTRHSVPSAVQGRAWTKNRENNPMQSRVDPGSQLNMEDKTITKVLLWGDGSERAGVGGVLVIAYARGRLKAIAVKNSSRSRSVLLRNT
jgi:hypothetical protein